MTIITAQVKHYFAGGNTGNGFYSFYDQIIGSDANRVFILKGGPGTGKSTFMKKIGEKMFARGFDLEFFHCSSDPNSLDGLVIPSLKIGFIDGTTPHMIDPINPGIIDEIINLGVFWNGPELKKDKEQILELNKKKKACFERAYVYLAAAKGVYQNWQKTNLACLTEEMYLKTRLDIKEQIFGSHSPTGKLGTIRHLFASAITPDGPVNFLESIFNESENLYVLDGPPGSGQTLILDNLIETALEHGNKMEVYHCALDPSKNEHLWLPELKTGIISSTWPHKHTIDDHHHFIDTSTFVKKNNQLYAETLKETRLVFLELFERAVTWLDKAKKMHAEIEKHYLPCMDFKGATLLREEILSQILESIPDGIGLFEEIT